MVRLVGRLVINAFEFGRIVRNVAEKCAPASWVVGPAAKAGRVKHSVNNRKDLASFEYIEEQMLSLTSDKFSKEFAYRFFPDP